MCGIAGIVGVVPEDPGVIERMTALLGHRGPDRSDVWRSPQAQLGHTRLSILDLSAAGDQPMRHGSLVLTYNGEVYNFRDLRRLLPGPFRSQSDSEVVLHAYQEHGPGCVHDLLGMFAFGVWDQKSGELFLARDRLGIKPLYYRPFEGGLAFASEVTPLLELGRPEIDRSALFDYLTYGYVATPKTPWVGIYKLPAAHLLRWREGRYSLHRYWQPEPHPDITSFEAAKAEAQELLERAVTESYVSDVPLGLFLSSGVDSATVTAFSPEAPLTFTLGQSESHRDEAEGARQLARHLGTQHREWIASVPDLGEAVDTVVATFGEPFGDSAALSVWLLSRFVRESVKVALSGEGGDEIFCGYRWYSRAMSRPSSRLAGLVARLAPTVSRLGRSQQRRSLSGLERYAAFLGVFTPAQVEVLAGPWVSSNGDTDPLWHYRRYWRPELPLHQRLQWVDLHTYLADDLLTKVDRASMAWSLEVRPPLLDHRIVNFALGLGVDIQRDLATDRGKRIPRSLLEHRLPPGHLDRPKRGFNLPISRWVREYPELWADTLGRLQRNGVLHRTRFMGLTNEQTWSLLVLDRWLLKHLQSYG